MKQKNKFAIGGLKCLKLAIGEGVPKALGIEF